MTKTLLLFLLWLMPSVAFAQSPDPVSPPRYGVRASNEHSPGGRLLIAYARDGVGRWITEFWVTSPGWMADGATPIVFARSALDSWEAQEQITWADSRTCPGLLEKLLDGNGLPIPGLIIPLDQQSRSLARDAGYGHPPAPDGYGPHVFWAPGAGPSGVAIQFSTYGGVWVEWSTDVDRTLKDCWKPEQPSVESVSHSGSTSSDRPR